MKVIVFGATGTIGRPLVAELVKQHEVTAVSRHERADEANVTWAQADAIDADSVARVLEGADVAYYLVHSLGRPTSKSATCRRRRRPPAQPSRRA